MRSATIISSGAIAVVKGPSRNLSVATSRSPCGGSQDHLCLERECRDRELGGRVGVREAPAEGTAGSNRHVTDVAGRECDQDMRAVQPGPLQPRMPDESADLELAVLLGDAVEAGDAVDVDDVRRMEEPVGEHRHEALSAREQLRLVAPLAKEVERLVDRACAGVGKWGEPHAPAPACAARVAARIGP